ncbi:MAG: hypothetical protein HDR01_09075 [Lachnospiraceae bacterium]|nr:hypothetical protein [Lachnospiraceae bacterium]
MVLKISEILGAMKKKRYHNEGASLLMVIIMVSFVGVLVAVAVYGSYYNFYMKYSDRSAKDNFYTVETALNEINMGLQRELSASMSDCYMLTNKQANMTVEEKERTFKTELYKSLWERIRYKDSTNSTLNTGKYLVNKLTLYLDKTRYHNGIGAIVLTTQDKALLEYDPTDSNKIVLKNVSLQYTDPRGYVSMLDTDIAIVMPEVSFVSGVEIPEIETYSSIAHVRFDTAPSTRVTIDGNLYAGGIEGMFPGAHSTLQFGTGNGALHRIIAKRVVVETGDSGGYSVSTLLGNQLWTEAIDVNSANISLLDNTYVKDDLTVDGRGAHITLGGQYFGYGDGNVEAADSSSILINGAHTTLDMSSLNNLMLLGRAFVGATHYDVDSTEESDYVGDVSSGSTGAYANHSDFMLGQSIAVKSDQLMYLVPAECMGYEDDKQVLAKNPITLAEYTTLTTAVKVDGDNHPVIGSDGTPELRYQVVRLDKVAAKLGKPLTSYGVSCRPVFRRIDGSILVYYYLYFTSETMANRFFNDYYNADKDALDAYIKEYITDFKWNTNLGRRDANGQMASPLHIAGNLIYFDGNGKATLRQDTKTEDANDISTITATVDQIKDTYDALYAKLILNRDNLSSSELGKTAYQNIVVPDDAFDAFVAPNHSMEFTNGLTGDDEVKALVENNKGYAPLVIDSATAKNLYFVVASGDVQVTAPSFTGLIISGGTITIAATCNLMEAEPSKARQALRCRAVSDPVNGPFAAEILIDGAAYLTYSTVPDSSNDASNEYGFIEISDLIYYENWNKK